MRWESGKGAGIVERVAGAQALARSEVPGGLGRDRAAVRRLTDPTALVGPVHGWSPEQRDREIDHYRKRVAAEVESQRCRRRPAELSQSREVTTRCGSRPRACRLNAGVVGGDC